MSPKVVARPATNLRDHQLISVSGSGFSSESQVDVEECLASDLFACAFETDHTLTVSPNTQITTITPAVGGTPSVTFFAKKTLEVGDGLVDCSASAHACILVAVTDPSSSQGSSVSTTSSGLATLSKHPSARAVANMPADLTPQALRAVAQSATPGMASAPLNFVH